MPAAIRIKMEKNILLVDNEEIFHFINSKVISLTGLDCDIQTSSNGSEAIEVINKYVTGTISAPDYIFIDLNMPLMDGFEFIRAFQLMKFPHEHKTTLVILTSSVDSKDKERALSLGIKHFVSKPLSEADIRTILSS